ncbi:MAG: hypothetical protein KJ949_02825, partial [Nanoarchaeota archaeon]|nr:hypothetical protein [Nanoarchaeota archaeon]
FFVNFANEFRTIDKKILNVNGNEAIENYISIVNNYNENIDSFSRKFQNSGPFLAIPESIGYMLPPNFQFKDIGSYLFINNWSQNKDTISLIDKFEDISKNEGGYLLLNSKSQILSKIIATKDAPFNLRKSAFDKLEKLSYDSERKPNETYEGGIMKTDLTYRDLILDELFANQNMEIEGFRKQPRDKVVKNVLKQIGLYKGNETYKIDNGEIK